MKPLRVVLVGRAMSHAGRILEALEPRDVIVAEQDESAPADVVVVPIERVGTVPRSHLDHEPFLIAVGDSFEASLDPRFDALWLEPLDDEDMKSVLLRARSWNASSLQSTGRALEAILIGQQARCDALRARLAREEMALRMLPNAPEIALGASYVELDDESAFAAAVRHEERRARRDRRRALLCAFEATEAAAIVAALKSYDVVLPRADGGGFALLGDAPPALVAWAREELQARAALLPYDGDALALLWATRRT